MTRIDSTLAALCIAILDGELGLNQILADRFEEMGSARAEIMRTLRSQLTLNGCRFSHTISSPFDLVLHSLPDEICWRFLSDFAEHVLPLWVSANPQEKAPGRAIEARRQWLEGLVSDATLDACRQAAWHAGQGESSQGLRRAAWASARGGGGDARVALRATTNDGQEARQLIALEKHAPFEGQRQDRFVEGRTFGDLSPPRLAADFQAYSAARANARRTAREAERQWQVNEIRQYLLEQIS